MTKPMRASDAVLSKAVWSAFIQPKIDGVRGCHLDSGLTSRTLKRHANKFTTNFFSNAIYKGFDGELAAAGWTDEPLCRLTTSAINTIQGEPFVVWWLFDYITPETINLPYKLRYIALTDRVEELKSAYANQDLRIRIVPNILVQSREEFEQMDAEYIERGFEGSIYRLPDGMYKEGYSTVREGGLLRVKRFAERDAIVRQLHEGEENTNVATIGVSGYTERSTHQENMIPNGMVGAMTCFDITTQKEITVAAGKMTHAERVAYWKNPNTLIGKTIKYKTFLKGVKDKPRFPTFQAVRADTDLS